MGEPTTLKLQIRLAGIRIFHQFLQADNGGFIYLM